MFEDYIEQYEDRFGDIFPTEEYASSTDSEIIGYIKECLKENKPMSKLYPTDYSEDIYY